MTFSNQHVLIDSCIIHNALVKNETVRKETEKILFNLEHVLKKQLYVSEFTHYEILRTLSGQKRKRALKTLNTFIEVPQSKERTKRATKLFNAYYNHKETKQSLKSISDIDIFLGALTFTKHKPLLLTANHCDFPKPFFSEVSSSRIEYRKPRGSKASIYYYFFKPNLEKFLT